MKTQAFHLLVLVAAFFYSDAKATTIFPIATNQSLVEEISSLASSGSNYLMSFASGTNACFQLVSTNGTLLGSSVTNGPSSKFPKAAFAGTNYLVFWFNNFSDNLYAQLVSPGGTEIGSPLSLGPAQSQGAQALLSDGTNFLLVWQNRVALITASL